MRTKLIVGVIVLLTLSVFTLAQREPADPPLALQPPDIDGKPIAITSTQITKQFGVAVRGSAVRYVLYDNGLIAMWSTINPEVGARAGATVYIITELTDVDGKPIDISVFDGLVSVLYDNGSVVSLKKVPIRRQRFGERLMSIVLEPTVTNP